MDSMIPVINRRPGKLWTFLQFPLTRFVLAVAVIALAVAIPQVAAKLLGLQSHTPAWAVVGFIIAAGVLTGYSAYVHVIEKRAVVELRRADAFTGFGLGALVGAALFCTTMLIMWLTGAWVYTGMHAWSELIYPLAGAVVAGVLEETLIRGVLFRILEESLGSWIALGLSAIIFGLLHAFNPGATVVSTAAIALEAGILLAAAYMYARTLWFVIGLHFAWNFTEGGIFATSVSGGKVEGLIGVQFGGSDLITGGKFGPEASLVAVLVCLAAGIAFIMAAKRSGRVLQPAWRRNK
jgi:membrane protease YdiL (CAAX protease family)